MPHTTTALVDIRRAHDRLATRLGWLDPRHSFSFAATGTRPTRTTELVVNDDDTVAPRSGFARDPHRDMEIVTWVLNGSLGYQDSEGNRASSTPAWPSGVWRQAFCTRRRTTPGVPPSTPPATEAVRFVQMRVVPDEHGVTPGYEQREIVHAPDAPYLHLFVARRDGRVARAR